MADEKKNKDEIEENFSQDNTDDIQEADDTFGLPDIDFDPVTPDEPETPQESTEEEESAEKEAEEVDQPYMYASRPGEEGTEEAADKTPAEAEETPETAEASSEPASTDESGEGAEIYHSTEEDEHADAHYAASMEEAHEEEKSAYVPGSYSSQRQTSNKTGMIVGVILVLILILAGVWFFVWYRPAQLAAEQEAARQEQLAEEQAAEAERQRQLDAERQAAEEEAARQAAAEAEEPAEPETGTIETISSRTGRYYVVVASAVDGDLAMDYAKKLTETGKNVKIIQPYGNVIFHRVTIQDLDTWAEAQNVANELKAEYGEGVWVKKY